MDLGEEGTVGRVVRRLVPLLRTVLVALLLAGGCGSRTGLSPDAVGAAGDCTPDSDAAQCKNRCGHIVSRCGATLDCGGCAPNATCGSDNVCVARTCVPNCNDTDNNCGDDDGCGGKCTRGTCGLGRRCVSGACACDVGVGIAAGGGHTCALTSTGQVLCWGTNTSGQLGIGTKEDSSVPVMVPGLIGITSVGAGPAHTCAVTAGGGVLCWGSNDSGQLGSDVTNSLVPIPVPSLGSGIASVALGLDHTCALSVAGAVICWGSNGSGQLGNNSTADSISPVPVTGLGNSVTAIASGFSHSCAIMIDGSAMCWGKNLTGELGDGSTNNRLTPVRVVNLNNDVTAIAAGRSHTCASTRSSGVVCWGANDFGQLGVGTFTPSPIPAPTVGGYTRARLLALGYQHTCAAVTDGGVVCWGDGASGQLGLRVPNDRSREPVSVELLDAGMKALAAGDEHTCGVTTEGCVRCWGDDLFGQLGDGNNEDSAKPVTVHGL
jgi:alpha-tubulin suppressor-like RCC1 family protein